MLSCRQRSCVASCTVLPEYMVPSAFVTLNLPADAEREAGSRGAAGAGSSLVRRRVPSAVGQMERTIAQIWQTLLGLPRMGVTMTRGHSLAALRLVARVASTFGSKFVSRRFSRRRP